MILFLLASFVLVSASQRPNYVIYVNLDGETLGFLKNNVSNMQRNFRSSNSTNATELCELLFDEFLLKDTFRKCVKVDFDSHCRMEVDVFCAEEQDRLYKKQCAERDEANQQQWNREEKERQERERAHYEQIWWFQATKWVEEKWQFLSDLINAT
jgi:hypothetical protein